MNQVILEGVIRTNVGSRYSARSTQRVSWLDVACTGGGGREDVLYVIAFGEMAKRFHHELEKGLTIKVRGYLNSYMEELPGLKRRNIQVVCEELEVLGAMPTAMSQAGIERLPGA